MRCFSPALYAVDTVVPLVGLGQRDTWHPSERQPWGRFMTWWLDLATVAGWILSSIFVLAWAKLSRTPG